MTPRLSRRCLIAAGLSTPLAGCGNPRREPAMSPVPVRIEVVAGGLDHPWALAFLPDGDLLVTERPGAMKRISQGKARAIAGVPPVLAEGQGGLFEVLPAPDFARTGRLFLTYAQGSVGANGTRLAVARLDGDRLRDLTPLWTASPTKRGAVHFGGRLVQLPDGTLLMTTGDGFDFREQAQRIESPLGKTIRVTETGQPAPGNPFARGPGVAPFVYTLGHRNPQGLAHDPVRGLVYQTEHGPRGGDEVNLLVRGGNFGWPVATRGMDYSGATISPFRSYRGMRDPMMDWTPSIAPSGLAVYRGTLFPEWNGDLFAGALVNRELRRIRLSPDGREVEGEERVAPQLGARVRDVRTGPDGALWLLTDEAPGQVVRLVRA
jgi:glucose/arabinose dehydrogenase